jgi:hypothetical protein
MIQGDRRGEEVAEEVAGLWLKNEACVGSLEDVYSDDRGMMSVPRILRVDLTVIAYVIC